MESNEEIERKLKELRTHVPFVERMISKVSKGNNPRSQSQLQRLQGLHSFLTKPMAKAPKMEMLLKMEAVLNSMRDKVQKAESIRPGSLSQQSSGNINTGGSSTGQLPTNTSPHGHISTHRMAASKEVKQHLGSGHMTSHRASQEHGSGNKTSPSYSHGSVVGHATTPGSSGGPGHGSGMRPTRPVSGERQFVNKPESKEDSAKERRDFLFERPKDARKSMDQPVHIERHRNHGEDKTKERGDDRNYSSHPSKHHDRSKGESVDPRIRSGTEMERTHERAGFVRHTEGESSHKAHRLHSYSDTRQEEGKISSKRNSLLDLPMPPCAPSGNVPQPHRESGNESQAVKDKFNSSREKLQKLFGITRDTLRTEKSRDGGSGSASDFRIEQRSNWRDDVRARAPFLKDSIHGASEDLERRDREYMQHRSLSLENTSSRSFNQPQISKSFSHSAAVPMELDPRRRLSSSQSSAFPQANHAEENHNPPPDSPMSPVQSPVRSSMDTPQSPDQDASFSPVMDTEDPSPVKTIPLQKQNLQEKGVDLEAIRKALAQIHSSERSKSGSGPSYRYEDFVGPAGKDDEPYDPEEVWKSVDSAPKTSHSGGSSSMSTMVASHRDVDLRQIPQAFTSRGNERSDQSMPHGAKDIDSRKVMFGHVSQIPLPQRSGSSHSVQSSMNPVGSSAQSGIRSSAWDQDIRNPRIDPRSGRGNAADVDMRFQHYRPHQPPGHSPQSQHSSVPSRQQTAQSSYPPLLRQPPTPSSAHPPLPAMPPPPLPESPQPPQPPLPRSPPPTLGNTDKESKKEMPSRLEHIRSKLAQNAGEFIRPGQRGVALSQMEKYKLKRQTSGEMKSPPHSSASIKDPLSKKSDVHLKSTSVLDMLLPESKSETVSKPNQLRREPEKPHLDASAPLRDPRLGPQESKLVKDKESPVRDPRLSSGAGISSNLSAKSHPLRDPRKDISKFSHSAKEKRDELSPSSVNDARTREERDPRKFLSASGSQARDPSLNRDPRQEHSLIKQDSRHEVGMVNRDPRKDFGSVSRDPRQDHKMTNRDPRQDLAQINREHRQDFGTPNRDPRQEHGKVSHSSIPLGREQHQDMGSFVPVSGSRDPRHDSGPYSKMPGPPFRDPRLIARSDRPAGNVWTSSTLAVTPNYITQNSQNMTSTFVPPSVHTVSPGFVPIASKPSVVPNREIMESDPSQSASGSLIGQTFTCLMMRGLPPFVHSHHIYRFFEEYILRDISIELDNNYNCKGAAYVHFPSHASAREALEKMNGYLLHGSPISLRICTVGILRQSKNAYEQLNRDREARLGLPERPRGNANPFYKPRPKEPIVSTPPPTPVSSKAVEDKAEVTKSEKKVADEEERKASSGRYSVLCGVKVSSVTTSSFKIPKIKKGEPEKPKRKDSSDTIKGAPKTARSLDKTVKAEKKYISKTLVSDSSESDIDVPLDKTPKTKKKRIIKKMIIESDSDSDSEPQKTKKTQAVASVKSRETSSSEDDSDSSSMVIDESAHVEEEEDETSDVSSVVSEPQIEQRKKHDIEKTKKQPGKKMSKGSLAKAKPTKKLVKPKKPKEKLKKKAVGKKTKSKKQPKTKFEFDTYKDGMKLTRHTQGELEEIIPTQNKLKVIIPVPHLLVVTLFEDDKGKKKGTKRRVTDVSPSLPPVVAEILPDELADSLDVKDEGDNLTKKPAVKKKSENKKKPVPKKKEAPEPLVKNKLPGSSRGIVPPVLEKLVKGLPYWTPTLRRGQKRKDGVIRRPISRKRARRSSSCPNVFKCWSEGSISSLEMTLDHCETTQSESDFLENDAALKRPISSPTDDFAAKKPRLEKEEFSVVDAGLQGSQSGLDVFDNSSISDELSDLTQLTPSLLEVEPTICNALPDASVLANVLSPPHMPPQSNDNSVSSVSELVEDNGESTLADIENSLPVKLGTIAEQGKDMDRSEKESKCDRVDDRESFEKVNDEDSLSKTVSQLVESLDESIMKEELSLDKRNENIQETGAEKSSATENVCATSKELPEHIESKEFEIPVKVSETKGDEILQNIADTELRREEALATADVLSSIAGQEKSSSSKRSDVLKSTSEDLQETPAKRSVVISDQITTNTSADSHKTSEISDEDSVKSQVVIKDDNGLDKTDPKLKGKMAVESPISDNTDTANDPSLKREEFKDAKNVDVFQKLEKDLLAESADMQCKTLNEIEEKKLIPKNSCKFEELKQENGEVLLASVKKQDKVEGKCSDHLERNTENVSHVTKDAEDSKEMKLDKMQLEGKEVVLEKSVTVSDVDGLDKKTDLENTAIDSKVHELGSESKKPDVDKFLDNKIENSMETNTSDINKAEGEEPDDDDTASIGKTSTCSFVDDASIVSSEGRELKTPDSGTSKKSKKAKSSALSIPLECRRVTRGSLVEPRVAETTEWDDGGIIDLFQCDLCDYVGRRVGSHLVNYHAERELLCEFKKEDFGPVIRDHVGPSKDRDDAAPNLDLSWIPEAMTFDHSVTCKQCDYFSNSRFDLIYHFLEHFPKSTEKVYHCRLCNYMSEAKEDFYNHVSSHTGEYRYVCDLCGHRAYKESLMKDHHADGHPLQTPKFSVSSMIEEDGWLYIHVCKVCMFVRIGLEAAEQHVQCRHAGKADIHKANMSRPVLLHSEVRKAGESEHPSAPRPRYKGKKKKKGKKGPDLDVFVGDEDEKEVKEETEEKAKQLVDRIASNMHTTTSAQLAQKRMSLLNTIFQKLDDNKEESDTLEQGSSQEPSGLESGTIIAGEGDKNGIAESTGGNDALKETSLTTSSGKGKGYDASQGKVSFVDEHKEQVSDHVEKDQSCPNRDESNKDNFDESPLTDDNSGDSDTDSTISAIEAPAFGGEQFAVGSGTLQETIRKLSAQLDEVAKEKAETEKKKQKDEARRTATSAGTLTEQRKSTDTIDDDSDSDALVICEDAENEEENYPQGDESKQDPLEIPSTSSLQNTIQSILREAHEVLPAPKLPQLRIRPAHQLIDPKYRDPQFRIVSKPQKPYRVRKTSGFVCSVAECKFKSDIHADVLKHIIEVHGPYKCVASGCHFVSKSRDMYVFHMQRSHHQLNFLVCPFLCKVTFNNFSEHLDHLSQHHPDAGGDVPTIAEVDNEEQGDPGFLRIESVGTLDPTAASQMFGEDFNAASATQSAPRSMSPIKITVSMHASGPNVSSPFVNSTAPIQLHESDKSFPNPYALGMSVHNTLPSGGGTVQSTGDLQDISVSFPMSMTSQNESLPGDSRSNVFNVNQESNIPGTKQSLLPSASSHLGNTTLSQTMPIAMTKGSESHLTTTSLEAKTTPSKSPLGGNNMDSKLQNEDHESGKPRPSVVNLEDDEEEHVGGHAVKKRPSPPGLATLPKCPPTVPIQEVFREYQPVDIFKILTTKLAPEVFKCMFNGCVFADDEPDTFLAHITAHGSDYRCCYCLMLMPTASELVEHVLTEHSNCQFQCKYCLYRAFTKIYMGVHLKNFHPYDEPRYIKVGTIRNGYPPSPPIDQFVRPYRCNYQGCQYRTVDSEAFRIHVQQNHGPFVILSCDFCHKHLHVIPLIDHMREHQMHAHQCPYCLHGDAERERLLGHLLNCHSGRRGKVLVRKHNEEENSEGAPKIEELSSPPPPPSAPSPAPSVNSSSKVLPQQKSPDKFGSSTGMQEKSAEESSPATNNAPSTGKETNQFPLEGRRISRSMSHELGDTDSNSGSGQAAEKTGLSGHALYRCGNNGCEYTSLTQLELREHLQVCDLTLDSTTKCYHCGKHCRHLSTLFDHLRVHGPKRYCCGVTGCDYRATMAHYFKNHMKQIHHCSGFKHLIKDPKVRDPELQEYVVYPKDAVLPLREGHKKRKNEFSFEDIPRIPRAHILYQDLKCYHCQYVSKIRLNLIKHLQLHEKYPDGIPEKLHISHGVSSPIPFKQPVNPVPCLERKELMFDKMMNLAGSSFDSKTKRDDDMRKKHPIPPEEYEKLPKFVPEERLHSCGIQNCNYVSCDDMMLKYHIRSLHSDMTTFPCPHCTDQTITVEKMSSHFKLHGDRLYRCGWCPYLSSRRNVVERHMKEKHHGRKSFDFVIREPLDPDASKKVEEQPIEQEPVVPVPPPPPPDPPQWQCGLCKFSSATQQEMVNHTSFKHSIKSQYKCGYCGVRSSVRTSFDAHFAAKHPHQAFRVLCMYYRLDSEDIEPISHGDSQNTHEPIWRRNDPDRIRHIRGIMLDDPEVKKTWLKKTSKGSPVKGEYVCPVCRSFKTVCLSTFRSHLCREADYDRYQCVECGVSNALLPNLQRHYIKMHHQSFCADSYLELPVEEDKEAWVESVLNHQNHLLKVWQEKGGDASHDPPPPSPAKSSKVLTSPVSAGPTSEVPPQQVGVVLHDSGSERGRFVCDACGCECRTAAGLKSHTTAMHQTRYKCHYCPFASNNEDAVKQHSSLKHPKLQNEVLDVSQRIRAQKGDEGESLSSQTQVAEGSKEICSAETGHKSGVETNESESEGVLEKCADSGKIYKCQFCPFTTNAPYTLSAHKRKKHVDLRMFMCNHCGSRFNTNNDAIRHHRWKHQNLKPHITFLDKGNEDLSFVAESDEDISDASFTFPVPESTSKRSPRHLPDQELKKTKGKRSLSGGRDSPVLRDSPSVSSLSDAEGVNPVPVVKGASEAQVIYSCCHCNHKSSKEVMEDHMKTQHRDLPYQVRREECDRVFTEVYIYKCIHCIVESISHAQSMDHWIQNHALLEFKYKMVLRHSGEVSNQVVTSTTSDKDPIESGDEELVKFSTGDPSVSTTSSGLGSDAASSVVITSSSEGSISTSSGTPLTVGKRRGSNLEMASPHRYSIDTDDDQSELGETVDEGDTGMPTSSDVESEEMMYKCGYCKKSSSSLQDVEAHLSMVHSDKPVSVKKLKLEVFDQLYRAEYECGYCGEKGRNAKMKKHQKSAHPNQTPKFTRVQKAPRENICYRCEVCAHVVKNLPSIRSHIRRHHPEANEFTFSRLTLGSPMRFPIKQPFKCNYCGDVGESVQEMKSHHAFLHSHLEFSVRNLRDEALSSVHSSSTNLNAGETFPSGVQPSPAYASSSAGVGPKSSSKSNTLSKVKNTARKSFPSPAKRTVAVKSTAKAHSNASSSSASEETSASVKESTLQDDKLYACVDLGGGFPVKLTVQKLGEVLNLQPQVVVDAKSTSKLV